MKAASLRSLLLLHLIVFLWGFTGILGKLISINAVDLVWFRMGIAVVGIAVVILYKRRSFVSPGKKVMNYLLTGFIIAAHWITFFHAIKVSNVSITLACLSAGSLFTAILEPLLYKTKFKAYELILGLMVLGGLLLIFSFEFNFLEGILFALISAFLASLFTVINGKFVKNDGPLRISFYEMLGGFALISIFLLTGGNIRYEMFIIPAIDIMWLLILGLVCTAFAFVISVEVMKELSPFTVSLTINLEPVYSIILALLIFGESEKMSGGFYAGAVTIIVALFINALLKRNEGSVGKAFRSLMFWQ